MGARPIKGTEEGQHGWNSERCNEAGQRAMLSSVIGHYTGVLKMQNKIKQACSQGQGLVGEMDNSLYRKLMTHSIVLEKGYK